MTSAAPINAQADNPVSSIRAHYAAINRDVLRYRKVKKQLAGFSTEGGELVAYFKGRAIMKLVATYFGEGGNAVVEYYYREGELIFAFRKQSTYDRPLSGRVVRMEEDRFYFQRTLIKWINQDGKEVPPSEGEFVTKNDEYLKSSQELLDGARSKAKTVQATN